MEQTPSDDDLRAFVASVLSNLHRRLREPEVIDEAIRDHRAMWTLLYRVNSDFDTPSTSDAPE